MLRAQRRKTEKLPLPSVGLRQGNPSARGPRKGKETGIWPRMPDWRVDFFRSGTRTEKGGRVRIIQNPGLINRKEPGRTPASRLFPSATGGKRTQQPLASEKQRRRKPCQFRCHHQLEEKSHRSNRTSQPGPSLSLVPPGKNKKNRKKAPKGIRKLRVGISTP